MLPRFVIDENSLDTISLIPRFMFFNHFGIMDA